MIKKVIRNCLLAILLFCVIGTIILFIREYSPKHIEFGIINKVSMGGNSVQGNCLLISKGNGVKEFPFLWGEGLYVYSIVKNQLYLVKNCKIPLKSFDAGISTTIQEDRVYYTSGMSGPGQDVYMRDISYAMKEKLIVKGITNYAVTANCFYYPTEYQTDERGKIIEKNLKSGKEQVIEEGIFNYMIADEGGLYIYDKNKNTVIKISMKTKGKTYFKNITAAPEWIGTGKGDHIIIIDESGKILDLNGKTDEKRVIGKVKGSYSGMTNCKYNDPYLFYDNEDCELYRVDLTNGKQKRILALASMEGIGEHVNKETASLDAYVNYCTDYIAIDTSYETGTENFPREHRRLLIFDYNGKLISKKQL